MKLFLLSIIVILSMSIVQAYYHPSAQYNKVLCTAEYQPVCGNDQKTYANRCVAERQHKVKVAYEGECQQEKGQSFRSDRKQYREQYKESRERVRALLQKCNSLGTDAKSIEKSQTQSFEEKEKLCQQFKGEVKKDIFQGILHRTDAWLKILTKIKEKVQESTRKNIPLENKAEILAHIDATILHINEIRASISEGSTPEELKKTSQQLREIWVDSRQRTELNALAVANAGVKGVIQRGEKMKARMEERIRIVRGQNKEGEKLEMHLQTFNTHLNAAAELQASAEAQIEIGSIKQGHALLKQAREELQQAHAALQAFIRADAEVSGG